MCKFLLVLAALSASLAQAKPLDHYLLMQNATFTIAPIPQELTKKPGKPGVPVHPDLEPIVSGDSITVGVDTPFEVVDSIEVPYNGRFVNVRFNGSKTVWLQLDDLESVAYIKPGNQLAMRGNYDYSSNGSIRAQARRIIARLGCHPGVDIRMSSGTPVTARGSGTITMAGVGNGWGNYVRINHGGAYTGYAHLSRISVRNGQSVSAGTVLGYSGCTGVCAGPHLHFEDTRPGSPSRACILRRDGGRR